LFKNKRDVENLLKQIAPDNVHSKAFSDWDRDAAAILNYAKTKTDEVTAKAGEAQKAGTTAMPDVFDKHSTFAKNPKA